MKLRLVPILMLAGCAAPADSPPARPADLYARAVGTFSRERSVEPCLKLLDEAIRLEPRFADAFAARGSIHRFANHANEASRDFTEAIRLDPKNAVALKGRATLRIQQGLDAEAVADLGPLIESTPTADAFVLRSFALRRLGRFAEAARDQAEAVARDQEVWESFYNSANSAVTKERWDDAELNYRLALLLAPAFAEAHLGLSRVHACTGRLDLAVDDLSAAAVSRPKDSSVWYARAELLRGLSRFPEALVDYDRALASRALPIMHVGRGLALEALSRPADAEKAYDAALEMEPMNREAYIARGRLRRILKRFPDAEADFRSALGIRASHDATGEMARLESDQEHWDLAVSYYELALKACPAGATRSALERELAGVRERLRK